MTKLTDSDHVVIGIIRAMLDKLSDDGIETLAIMIYVYGMKSRNFPAYWNE